VRLSKSWIIASKDFRIYKKKKNIIYSLIIVPLLASISIPAIIGYAGGRNGGTGISAEVLIILLPAFTVFFMILAGFIPTTLASYSLVGEKVEKSLEPLLATPVTDSEILLGKGIAAFLPPLGAILGGAVIFMVLMNRVTRSTLGYDYFPNWNAAIVFLLMVPLAIVLSVEWNVIISSRVSDVRVAQQFGIFLIIPFAGIYVAGELNLIPLSNTADLLIISGVLFAVDLIVLYVAKATFRREEILTKWK
jgi:ABC-type Na+ efflux pump permease subunit